MTTEERLAKVERELGRVKRRSRWLLYWLVCLALALGFSVFVGASGPEKAGLQGGAAVVNEVRANGFVLEDETGQVRAVLGMDKARPALTLFDPAGRPRVVLMVGNVASGLGLLDEASKARVSLGMNAQGPGLRLYDARGTERALVAVDGILPGVFLSDEAGTAAVLALVVDPEGPVVGLLDGAGKPICGTP